MTLARIAMLTSAGSAACGSVAAGKDVVADSGPVRGLDGSVSWAVAEWALPRLSADERRDVRRAAREAIEALAREGDTRIVRALEASVWSQLLAA